MNIKRFTAPTAREALAKARMAFGDGTLILSNRPTAGGVEVVATAEDALSSLHGGAEPAPNRLQERADDLAASQPVRMSQTQPHAAPVPQPARQPAPAARSTVAHDTEQLAMSTLSFQDYVRERMLRP